MEMLAGLPFVALRVDRAGVPIDGAPFVPPPDITDLLVISHGWKNDQRDARTLYETLLANVRAAAGDAWADGGRRFGVVGVFWPAFRFLPDLSLLPDGAQDDGMGGAAGAGDDDVPRDELAAYATQVAAELGTEPLAFAAAALEGARGGRPADDFVDRLRALLSHGDDDLKHDHRALMRDRGGDLVADLANGGAASALAFDPDAPEDAEMGGAANLGRVVDRMRQWRAGGRAAVASILNQATYYEMKARAGAVGAAVAALLGTPPPGVRVHLIGHSFGARLVSAICANAPVLSPASLTLLQGAFSHNGLGSGEYRGRGGAGRDGAFRAIVAEHRVSGPIVVTHTHRDSAVGFFYAVASALSGEASAAWGLERVIGGPTDRHGGMGANGARSLLDGEGEAHIATLTGDAVALGDTGTIAFAGGRVHNVLADAIVADHNDVANPQVAALVWAAVR